MKCIDCKRSVGDGALRCVPCQRDFEDMRVLEDDACEECGARMAYRDVLADYVTCRAQNCRATDPKAA